MIERSERLGLVERVPDPAEGRLRLLRLTPGGRGVRRAMERALPARILPERGGPRA